MLLYYLLQAVAMMVFAAGVGSARECRHGLTANDIAVNSGLNLSGKVALVTGGRSGLGYAITEALLRVGCKVVIASRNETANQRAVYNLNIDVSGADISYMIFDLESFDNVKAFAAKFAGRNRRLDYYFGNAGQGAFGAQPLTVDGYERIFQVNYLSQALLLDLLLPLLRKSQPARAILTASSLHASACGDLGISPEYKCWENSNTIEKLPFDQAGLDAVGNRFPCPPIYSAYSITKFLMTQLARETTKREANSGNQVSSYSWAPGNINTDLNPGATCCIGPIDRQSCRYQLPYVGPTDENGNPKPPNPPVRNHWSSPAHGAMAGVYAALVASSTESGSFFATYWECKADKGYFPQGITPEVRSQIYELSRSWTHSHIDEINNSAISNDSATFATSSASFSKPKSFVASVLMGIMASCMAW